ncbi:MAG TPA: hypothetical protein VNQ34_02305 [Xanthobacteraceae bacterium]|nr:hypothetical protein [Xanthobacteraceae bacterium]
MASNEDKHAITALLARYVAAFEEREEAQKIAADANARASAAMLRVTNIKTAFGVFGIDLNGKEVWAQIREMIGQEAYNKAIEQGKAQIAKDSKAKEDELDEDVDLSELDNVPEEPAAKGANAPTVREGILEKLTSLHPRGSKAADLQKYLETAYSMKLHDKTVGMTLYRLSQEKPPRVRRQGHTWFFVPQHAETRNPAGETAGLEDLLS